MKAVLSILFYDLHVLLLDMGYTDFKSDLTERERERICVKIS